MAKVVITVTVDWEGIKLEPTDLSSMDMLGKQLDKASETFGKPIPITHFICPAYFSRNNNPTERQTKANQIIFSRAIRPIDEVAVHVHCWKSLAMEAGIPAQDIQITPVGQDALSPPNIFRDGINMGPDTGYEVPLGVYNEDNITNFIRTAKTLVEQYLHRTCTSFRCGMWVSCDAVFRSLPQTGLRYEASAGPFNYFKKILIKWDQDNKFNAPSDEWNAKIWGDAPTTGQDPVYVQNSLSFAQYNQGILGITDEANISQPKGINGIIEIPDTGLLIPVTNFSYLKPHIEKAFQLARESNTIVYLSIGFHQENCNKPCFFETPGHLMSEGEKNYNRLWAIYASAISAIDASMTNKIELEFLTIQQAGALFQVG
jgi:hypothetical protein